MNNTESIIHNLELGDIFRLSQGPELTISIVSVGFPIKAVILYSEHSGFNQNEVCEFNPLLKRSWERLV